MALVLADRVKDTTTSTGTGTITLAGAPPAGFQSFAVIGNANTTYYTIAGGSQWEVGIGTYTSSGTTLSRDTVLSSSSGTSLVDFSAGTKDVFVTYPAEQAVYEDASGNININITGSAANLAGGASGSIPYQSGANATTFLASGTGVLVNSAGNPSYSMTPSLTQVTVAGNPSTDLQVATKQYVDGLVSSGITYHEPVKYEVPSTTGNLTALYNQPGGAGVGVGATLTNNGTKAAFAPDGPTASVNDRVLIYNQTNAFENGVYTVTTVGTPDPGGTNWVLTRATDADTYGLKSPNSLGNGDAFYITAGDTGAGETYVVNTVGTITFGTTAITFVQISDSTLYTAGNGLQLTSGTVFSLISPVVTSNGGTGLTSFTSGGAVYATSTSALTTGTLPVASGGTGATTLTGVIKGNGTSAFTASAVALGSEVSGTLPVGNGGTGATTLTANNVLLGNGASALQVVAPGTTGNVLTSNGTTWISQAGAAAASVQEFSSSGTWTKPSGAQFVLVEVWGAGGGGGRPRAGTPSANSAGGGGGGGAYNYSTFLASELPSSVTVTIGAGGTGATSNASNGGIGGSTTFGTFVTSYGGGGGAGTVASNQFNNGGSGGGTLGAGTTATNGTTGAFLGGEPRLNNDGTTTGVVIRAGQFGGGAGGGGITGISGTFVNGAPSGFGGGGGGACQCFSSAAGNGGSSSDGGGGGGAGGGRGAGVDFSAGTGGSSTGTSGGGGANGNSSSFAGSTGGFRQGGGGGYGELITGFQTYSVTNNGAEVVALGNGFVSSFNQGFLFVSSNGLSSYTAYPVSGSFSFSTSNIVYDGSKYVIYSGATIRSTTNFTAFTTHTTPPDSATACSRGFRYLNGLYFACRDTDLYYSSDLTTWTRCNVNGGSAIDIRGVAFDGTRYYALAQATSNANVYVSTTLTSGWVANNSGASNPRGIDAKAGELVVSSGLTPFARYSTNNGSTWNNVPTTLTTAWNVQYLNGFLIITGNANANLYYTFSVAAGFTTASDPATAYWYNDAVYNGTRYVFSGLESSGGSGSANMVIASTAVGGSYTWQSSSAYAPTGGAGGAGGIGGGGGGGGGFGNSTTGNGGTGGVGYCRVYTW